MVAAMAVDEGRDGSRCSWATGEWLTPYHDEEWGVPVHDDVKHFEFLVLEGAQAGLSWLTVLKRREGYRSAFAGFDPVQVAGFSDAAIEELLTDARIIRNRQKVLSVRQNARALVDVVEELGSFDRFFWEFVDGAPIVNRWGRTEEIPASTDLSAKVSSELRRRGFGFVGPTVCYSHLQAAGLVNDHLVSCFRHRELAGALP
jgi:DNA-3-methyladenine glycosylase I